MELGLSGKVVLVAGSSRGIGLAIARAFAAEGARVMLSARSPEPLEAARAGLAHAFGDKNIQAVAGDLSSESDIQRVLDAAETRLGPLDAVVANVGSGTAQGGYAVGRAEWSRVLDENLLAGALLAGAALERLTGRGQGSLTFVGSIAGLEALAAPVPYSAAKAALGMAVKLYAQQVGPKGVRVNMVAPGNILFPGGSWEKKLAERREFFEAYVQREVPLGRFGTPEEIAGIVVFLASEQAGFVTGAIWTADGGQTRA
jgi:3-oxoacyl-[acyl-carrier protein] reductase